VAPKPSDLLQALRESAGLGEKEAQPKRTAANVNKGATRQKAAKPVAKSKRGAHAPDRLTGGVDHGHSPVLERLPQALAGHLSGADDAGDLREREGSFQVTPAIRCKASAGTGRRIHEPGPKNRSTAMMNDLSQTPTPDMASAASS